VGDRAERDKIADDLISYIEKRHGRVVDSTVLIRLGPKSWKSITLLKVPDPSTGELRVREFRARTYRAVLPEQDDSYDFLETEYHWHCEGDEIEVLRQFLNETAHTDSRYECAQALCSNVIDHDSLPPRDLNPSLKVGGANG